MIAAPRILAGWGVTANREGGGTHRARQHTRPALASPGQQRAARPPDRQTKPIAKRRASLATRWKKAEPDQARHPRTKSDSQRRLFLQPCEAPPVIRPNTPGGLKRPPHHQQTPDQSKRERLPQKYSDNPPYIDALRKIYRATTQ